MHRLLTTLLATLLLAGCASSGSDGSGQNAEQPAVGASGAAGGSGDAVTFVADDVEYTDAPSTLPAGQNTIALVNQGNAPHDVAVEELGDEVIATAQGGQTVTGQTELEPGTYTYYCSIPGHRAAGMEGTFTVE